MAYDAPSWWEFSVRLRRGIYIEKGTHNDVVFSVEEIRGISARFVEDEKHEGAQRNRMNTHPVK